MAGKKQPAKALVLGKTAHESAQPTSPANNTKGLTKLQFLAGTIAGHVAASDRTLLPEVVAQFAIETAMYIIEQTEILEQEASV